MTTLDIILRFLEAAALWALVGLEREVIAVHRYTDSPKNRSVFWGLRSYTLMSLLGAISVYLGEILGSPQNMVIFIGTIVFLFILLSYIYSAFHHDLFGVTSELAALVTFLLGAIVMTGEIQIAIFIGVLLTIMLAYKSRIAPIIDKIGGAEITNTLKFAVIALIILPLLPDHKYAIHDIMVFLPEWRFTLAPFFNPYSIWQFVVIMSGVSYVGYILSKIYWSRKWIIFSGAIGGMVSSTAVTSSMAEKSLHDPAHFYPTVIATVTACTIMLFRIIIIVVAFNPYLLGTLLIPIIAMILTSWGILLWLWKKSWDHETVVVTNKYESPFQIGPALKFAWLIVLIKFFSTLAGSYQDAFAQLPWPDGLPIYILSFFSGLADVDAITQDMAEKSALWSQVFTSLTATIAIIIALVTNTAVKIGLAKKFWSPRFGSYVLRILGSSLLVGVIVLGVMIVFGYKNTSLASETLSPVPSTILFTLEK